jgi:hypothetical protein
MTRSFGLFIVALFLGAPLAGCSNLRIDYEFNTGQPFSGIQGAYSDKAATTYRGYQYYFNTKPTRPSLPWDSATLHSPADINGGNDVRQCFTSIEGGYRTLDFYCGGTGVTPATPPTGSYQVNVTPKVYAFDDVTSRAIPADLDGIYVPAVRLTMAGGMVTQLEWQWWKKTAGGWVNPSDAELAANLGDTSYEIAQADWAPGARVRGELPLTTSGSLIPPSQSFTPGGFRIAFGDRAGYHYGFEWR